MIKTKRERCFSRQPPAARRRSHEAGAFARPCEHVQRSSTPLRRIAVKQLLPSFAIEHKSELPADIIRVGKAIVEPEDAEDRHDMRGITDEENAAMPIIVQAQRVGGVDAPPLQFPRLIMANVREDSGDARADIIFPKRLLLALAFPELVVHAPDVIRLFVDQHRPAGVAAWFEEGPAL